tara:strand:+ start:715 stop:1020 length:306 start_codon:yes stop_codon:yes gene_type:complete
MAKVSFKMSGEGGARWMLWKFGRCMRVERKVSLGLMETVLPLLVSVESRVRIVSILEHFSVSAVVSAQERLSKRFMSSTINTFGPAYSCRVKMVIIFQSHG